MRTILVFILSVSFFISLAQNDSKLNVKQAAFEKKRVNALLNEWHGLAAVGDTTYFDFFDDSSYYLGTDSKEIWSLKEFKDFAFPHFKRGSAWMFKTKDRNVFVGDFGHYAWFDEIIDTWMGLCRGTGVLEKIEGDWKIKHYSLSILIPNSKINQYLEIIKEE